MTEKNDWSKYIDATAGGALNVAIAKRLNLDPATIGRWRTGAVDPKPRQVVAYARAFAQSPIQALVAAGYLTPDEVGIAFSDPRSRTLEDFSTVELAEEITERLSSDPSHLSPPSEVRGQLDALVPLFDGPTIGNVGGGFEDDLRAVATERDEESDEGYDG